MSMKPDEVKDPKTITATLASSIYQALEDLAKAKNESLDDALSDAIALRVKYPDQDLSEEKAPEGKAPEEKAPEEKAPEGKAPEGLSEMKRITATLAPSTYQALEDLANARHGSLADALRDAIALSKWFKDTQDKGANILVQEPGEGGIKQVIKLG